MVRLLGAAVTAVNLDVHAVGELDIGSGQQQLRGLQGKGPGWP
jgi:hypothetical protein